MMKYFIGIVVIAGAVAGYVYFGPKGQDSSVATPTPSPEGTAAAEKRAPFTDGTYRLDPAKSSMEWAGTKTLIKDYTDRGTIALSDGTVIVLEGNVTQGSVTVDMTTIHTLSTGRGSGESMMEKHIKSADFFDVEKFPSSAFTLKSFTNNADGTVTVDGNLTVKGITKPVSFPATVAQEGDTLTLAAREIRLDRTEWDIRYGSGKFFQNLGDNVINDIFTVSFTAVGIRVR